MARPPSVRRIHRLAQPSPRCSKRACRKLPPETRAAGGGVRGPGRPPRGRYLSSLCVRRLPPAGAIDRSVAMLPSGSRKRSSHPLDRCRSTATLGSTADAASEIRQRGYPRPVAPNSLRRVRRPNEGLTRSPRSHAVHGAVTCAPVLDFPAPPIDDYHPRVRGGRRALARAKAGNEHVVAIVTSGAVVGVVVVVMASSFAALIYSGPLASNVAAGVGLNLAGAAIVLAVTAWSAGRRGVIGAIQVGPAAVLAVVAATTATALLADGGSSRDAFLTVVATIVTTTLLTVGVFLALGASRMGNLMRFVPYPVVGGFLAGTGWLLAQGGFAVSTRIPLTLRTLDDLATIQSIERWLPALVFAIALLIATRLANRPLVIPVGLAIGLGLFATWMLATGTTISEAQSGQWLLGPFPSGALWESWALRSIAGADWAAVLAQAGGIATAVLVSVLVLLLNVSGTELLLGHDLDSNVELRSAGIANLLGGLAGGAPGFHSLSLTSLGTRMHARARPAGAIAAVIALATLLFGGELVALIPRMLLGGLLLFLGLSFLVEWVIEARRTLPLGDYAIVLAILVTIVGWGLLPGVAVGLVLAVALFAVNYSRTDLVRHSVSGTAYPSNGDRPPAEREALLELADRVHVMRLQGFIFFGTATGLVERILERASSETEPGLRFLILDFRGVTGVDSSATLSFRKVTKLAATRGFELILSSTSEQIRTRLEQGGVREESGEVRFEPDLDRSIQRCEDVLLAEVESDGSSREDLWSTLDDDGHGFVQRLGPYFERAEVAKGHVLIRQGEAPDDIYLLERGRLTVEFETEHGERLRLRTVAPGAVLGEVALYTGARRVASVIADEPSVVLRLSREAFERIETEDPQLAAALHRWFARLLALRLSDTLRSVDALMR